MLYCNYEKLDREAETFTIMKNYIGGEGDEASEIHS